MKNQMVSLLLVIILHACCRAQQPDPSKITGVWKGTSLCQVKNSPCHDENVVYYFSRNANAEDSFTLKANKIVNGREEEMGDLDFVYDKTKQTLTCSMINKSGKKGVWLFKIDGDKIHGTLTVDEGILYRLIEVSKKQ